MQLGGLREKRELTLNKHQQKGFLLTAMYRIKDPRRVTHMAPFPQHLLSHKIMSHPCPCLLSQCVCVCIHTHTRSCLSIKLTNLNLNCLTPLKKSKLTSHFSEISSLCPEHKTSTYAKRARSLAKLLLYKKHPLPLLRTFLHHFKTRSSFHLALNTLFAPLPSETELP